MLAFLLFALYIFTVLHQSTQGHAWSTEKRGMEGAILVNHVAQGSVCIRHMRREELLQGAMDVAAVHCARCQCEVGWVFGRSYDDECDANAQYVGRVGLVWSAISMQAAQVGWWG